MSFFPLLMLPCMPFKLLYMLQIMSLQPLLLRTVQTCQMFFSLQNKMQISMLTLPSEMPFSKNYMSLSAAFPLLKILKRFKILNACFIWCICLFRKYGAIKRKYVLFFFSSEFNICINILLLTIFILFLLFCFFRIFVYFFLCFNE